MNGPFAHTFQDWVYIYPDLGSTIIWGSEEFRGDIVLQS